MMLIVLIFMSVCFNNISYELKWGMQIFDDSLHKLLKQIDNNVNKNDIA